MKDNKIASTPERAPATRTTDDTHSALTEQSIILNHMLNGLAMNPDKAYSKYGIKHLHSIIPKIEKYIKVNRTEINRPHPRTLRVRAITSYWIDDRLIGVYASSEAREELKKQQTSVNIAKSRANDNKALVRLCSYCKRETLEAKVHEIYGQQEANDNN
jgi:bifunctional pyridoxal-dependent enzyme with beta-cystathionase and maltose regulon repressor activities